MKNQSLFERSCAVQADHFVEPSSFRRQCNMAVFEAANDAASDAHSQSEDAVLRVVKSDTGTGKTTFCVSLIAANLEANHLYSAAYVVGTIKEAQNVFEMLAPLLPDESVYVHTSGHANEADAQAHGGQVVQHVQRQGGSVISKLRQYPVVVCTHELWLRDMQLETDLGVRCYAGASRQNVFVDEFPETVEVREFSPADLDELADEFERIEGCQHMEGIARRAANAFRDRCAKKTGRFSLADFVSQADIASLSKVAPCVLAEARNRERSENVLAALIAIGRGQAFLERSTKRSRGGVAGQKTLVTYHDTFKVHPGLVVLDATAHLQLRVQAGGNVKVYQGASVDYRQLAVTQIDPPERFKHVSGRTASQEDVADYAVWIEQTLREHTEPGQRVLAVVPKKVAEILDAKTSLRSRSVDVLHWGAGIGSNSYRDCEAVFTFSEFHLPRTVYLARSIAALGKSVTAEDVKAGNGSALIGNPRLAMEAHRLRWFKQLVARGRVREVDSEGRAAPMRLYSTMDRDLLVKAMPGLFPKAPPPALIARADDTPRTQGERLCEFLLKVTRLRHPACLTAKVLTVALGINAKDLRRVFMSKHCANLQGYGWSFVAGRGRASSPMLKFEPVVLQVEGFGCINQ